MEEAVYWYWLSNIEGIGTISQHKMLAQCESPREIFYTNGKVWEKILTKKQICALEASRDINRIAREYAFLEKNGITFLSYNQEEYPRGLREIEQAPIALYRKGKPIPREQKRVAVVGARDCTIHGMTAAGHFAKELARAGVCIVSGLARGIDGNAHRGALEAWKENPSDNGLTGGNIGVLGCGINIRYPLEHYDLYEEMEQCGTLISEYNWNIQPERYRFPMRNRIMSGISDAILVVEAKKKSGALITVEYGLEQGKDICALPGRISDRLSDGCNRLIQQGAALVTTPQDVLYQLGLNLPDPCRTHSNAAEEKNFVLESDEKLVYSCLDFEPKYVDSIIQETGLSVQETLSILFRLESGHYIKQIINSYYVKTELEIG